MQGMKAMDKKNYTLKKRTGDESAYDSNRLSHTEEHQRNSQPNIVASVAPFVDFALLPFPLHQGEGDEVYAKEEAERSGRLYGAGSSTSFALHCCP